MAAVFLAVGAAPAVAGSKDLPILKPAYRDGDVTMRSTVYRGPGEGRTPLLGTYCGVMITIQPASEGESAPLRVALVSPGQKVRTTLMDLKAARVEDVKTFRFERLLPFRLEIHGQGKWLVYTISGLGRECSDQRMRDAAKRATSAFRQSPTAINPKGINAWINSTNV